MNIFIDANIYLDFFFYSQDDLEELRKLGVLLKEKKATLWLPRQVEDEVVRKREAQIASALKALRDQTLNLKFPQICQGHDELLDLRELQRKYALLHEKLLTAVAASARTRTLKADQIIDGLFGRAQRIEVTREVLDAARNRMDRGNPPGKDKKLGDAISWECLLAAVPSGEDLHLVSRDQDFASVMDREKPNSFLEQEWKSLKSSCLKYYGQLATFLRHYFPAVNLAEELERAILIERLAASSAFAETHALVARLSWYDKFTLAELTSLLQAVASNNQVYWIILDPDVNSFVSRLVKDAEGKVPSETISAVMAHFPNPAEQAPQQEGIG